MTVKELAKLCSVSPSTVSRVLNNDMSVSEAVRRRVVEAGRKYGYFDDVTESGKKGNIGLIFNNCNSLFFRNMMCLLHMEIGSRGYMPYIKIISDGENEIKAAEELSKKKKMRGIVFLTGRGDYTEKEITAIKVPCLFCTFTNRFGTLSAESYSSVSVDDYMTGYFAAETLIMAGHRRIGALLNDRTDKGVCELRYSGFRAALADNGIAHESDFVAETKSFSMESAYEKTRELLENAEGLTAIFATSDEMAVSAIKAISDMGLRVPEDISVIGIDGLLQSHYTVPTLTTVVQPSKELARKSVQVLSDVIEKGEKNRQISLPIKLRLGKSIRYRENAPL